MCHWRPWARKGEPGYCDEKLEKIPDNDFDYTPDTPDDVSAERAWGFCDKKCFASRSSIMANVLQQVSTGFFSSRTKNIKASHKINYAGDIDSIEWQGMFPNDQKQSWFKLQSLGQTGALRSQENNSHSQSLLWEKIIIIIIIIIWTRARILCNRITTAFSLGRKWCLSGDIIMIIFSSVDSCAGWLWGASLHPDWGQGCAYRGGQQGRGLCQAQLCGSVRQVRERGDYYFVI